MRWQIRSDSWLIYFALSFIYRLAIISGLFQARKERQLHMQMYPGWSARDNYAQSKEVDIITGYNNY